MLTTGQETGSASAVMALLADGRFPSGGHAHSDGIEIAIADGLVRCVDDVEAFCRSLLTTSLRNEAGIAVAACLLEPDDVAAHVALDDEAAARICSPAIRRRVRRRGRALLRVAGAAWPMPWVETLHRVHADGPVASMVMGAAGTAAGLTPRQVAVVVLHDMVSTPSWAALRLLELDPAGIAVLLASLADDIDRVAAETTTSVIDAAPDWSQLPAYATPRYDMSAERHAHWKVRLFAS